MAEETEQVVAAPKKRGRKPSAAKVEAVAAKETAAQSVQENAIAPEKVKQNDAPVGESLAAAQGHAAMPDEQPKATVQDKPQQPSAAQDKSQQVQPQQQQQMLSKKQRWMQQHGRFRNRNGQQYGNMPPQMQQVPRDPNLPEYKLVDIHSWDNATIVERMCPDANAEDLGAMKRHDIIFNAIRSYLARGGAVMASG